MSWTCIRGMRASKNFHCSLIMPSSYYLSILWLHCYNVGTINLQVSCPSIQTSTLTFLIITNKSYSHEEFLSIAALTSSIWCLSIIESIVWFHYYQIYLILMKSSYIKKRQLALLGRKINIQLSLFKHLLYHFIYSQICVIRIKSSYI